MNDDRDIEFDELFGFVNGQLSEARTRALAERIAADAELAAQVEFLRAVGAPREEEGRSVNGVGKAKSLPPTSFARRRPRMAAAFLLLLTLGTTFGVAWAVFYENALFADNFNDSWLDQGRWFPARPRVKETDGFLRLQNRGCVVTHREFTQPVSITFRWRWMDLGEFPRYHEVLTVALHTTGTVREERSWELDDGLLVKLNAQEGSAYLLWTESEDRELKKIGSSDSNELQIPAEAWHDVKITDDGKTVCLYLRGPAMGDKYWTTPVFRLAYDRSFPGRRIGMYNRESVGEFPHISHIDDFRVKALVTDEL